MHTGHGSPGAPRLHARAPFPRPVRMGLAYKAAVVAARAKSHSRPPEGVLQIEPRTTYQLIGPSKMPAAMNVAAAATK
jgi:hypothetical protein